MIELRNLELGHLAKFFSEIGYNYRMPEFMAISLLIKLKFLSKDIKKRAKIASIYKKIKY